MHLRIAGSSESASPVGFEQKELALESLLEFCREPDLMLELYENYDCDIHCTNLFETLVKFTARCAIANVKDALAEEAVDKLDDTRPSASFNILNRLALSGLLAIMQSIASRCIFDTTYSHQFSSGALSEDLMEECCSKSLVTLTNKKENLRDRKKKKNCLTLGAQVFNADPDRCVGPLQNIRLLPIPATAQSMAVFLKDTPGLEMRVVGEYLTKDRKWNSEVCKAFVKSFNFVGQPIVTALREFLATFRLPGESQQIERMMEAFSTQYFISQPVVGGAENFPNQVTKEELVKSVRKPDTVSSSSDEEESSEAASTRIDASVSDMGPMVAANTDSYKVQRWVCYENFFWRMKQSHSEASNSTKKENTEASHFQIACKLSDQLKAYDEGNCPEGFNVIKSADTIFILAYSIIMLNTDLHKSQVKNKMKLEEFIRNNRGINSGTDLPTSFLEDIYETIRDVPISLHDDNFSHSQPDDIYWDRILRKQKAMMEYATFSSIHRAGIHERDMFFVVWEANALDTLITAFHATRDMYVMEQCLSGFWNMAHIATYYNQVEVINLIVKRLCEFMNYSLDLRCQLALPVTIQCITHSSHLFRDCWGDVLEVLLKLNSLDLLPPEMTDFDDFTDAHGKPLKRFYTVKPPKVNVIDSLQEEVSPGKYYKWLAGLTSFLFSNSAQDTETELEFTNEDSPATTKLEEEPPFDFFTPSPTWTRSATLLDTKEEDDKASRLRFSSDLLPSFGKAGSTSYSKTTQSFQRSTKLSFQKLKKMLHQDLHLDELLKESFKRLPTPSCIALAEWLVTLSWPTSSNQSDYKQSSYRSMEPYAAATSSDTTLSHIASSTVRHQPIEWDPLLKPSQSKLRSYRNVADPIFCLEALMNLLCLRVVETRDFGSHDSTIDVLWKMTTFHFDLLLRRYIIPAANRTVLAPCKEGNHLLAQHYAAVSIPEQKDGTPPLDGTVQENEQSSEQAEGSLFSKNMKAVIFERLYAIKSPSALGTNELMFVERLMVNVLRLCIRLLYVADEKIFLSLIRQLHLVAHLHPNIFHLHSERVVSALQVLMVQWDFLNPHSFYGIQVILILFQRIAPILPHYPHHGSAHVSHTLALSALDSLSVWLKDTNALSHLTQFPHYQTLLQTLLVFALHNKSEVSVPVEHTEYATQDLLDTEMYMEAQESVKVDYSINLQALDLLTNLLPNIISVLTAEMSGLHSYEDSGISTPSTETGMPEWKFLWLPTVQAVALVFAFGPKPVQLKAITSLQLLFLGSNSKSNTEKYPYTFSFPAAFAFPCIDDPFMWREGLKHVLLPLITYDFHYPYSKHLVTCASDEEANPYQLPTQAESISALNHPPVIWMAKALSRRYTLEGALQTLGIDEVCRRKSDSASVVCRIVLSRLNLLLSPCVSNGIELLSVGQHSTGSMDASNVNFGVTQTEDTYDSASKLTFQKTEADMSLEDVSLEEDGSAGKWTTSLGQLIPVFEQLIKLLVHEAVNAPPLFRDQHLETIKNFALVVATSPAVENVKSKNFNSCDEEILSAKIQLVGDSFSFARLLVVSIVKRLVKPYFMETFEELSAILLPASSGLRNVSHSHAIPERSDVAAASTVTLASDTVANPSSISLATPMFHPEEAQPVGIVHQPDSAQQDSTLAAGCNFSAGDNHSCHTLEDCTSPSNGYLELMYLEPSNAVTDSVMDHADDTEAGVTEKHLEENFVFVAPTVGTSESNQPFDNGNPKDIDLEGI